MLGKFARGIGDFVNEEEKVLLFKGVNFDLSGHVKIHKEIKKIMEIKSSSSSEGKDKEEGNEEEEKDKEMDFRLHSHTLEMMPLQRATDGISIHQHHWDGSLQTRISSRTAHGLTSLR